MQDERWEAKVTDSLRPLMPRAMPSARFVHDLSEDVQRAAIALFEPLLPHWSEGGARVKLGSSVLEMR